MKKIWIALLTAALLLAPCALAQGEIADALSSDLSADETAHDHEDEFTDEELAAFEAELDAYWEKADPLYGQIQDLGDRQSEMYEEAGIALDTDDEGFLTEAEYETYIRGLNVLTEDEIARVIDVNARAGELYDQAEALDEEAQAEQMQALYDEADQLFETIAPLESRLRVAEEEHYVDNLTDLSDAQRAELKDMYATQRDLEAQLAELETELSAGAQHLLYSESY